ncbi:MAG TPA: 2-amino-4-hydroxy-6-hydroxymethyldihydropteridine diphosphokinase [Pelobium sp.]|nr:2-amino-4-hydroxy-6-hydroxymethyldihydropteridine diphosphokinase [Pelobium sp.]
MNRLFLGLGSNLGDRLKNLDDAFKAIELSLGAIVKKSSVYETKAWGKNNQPDFLNMAVEVMTDFVAEDVLSRIQKIETDLGRIRIEKWGARTMDIDILFFNTEKINTNRLIVPHPLMAERKFVLLPLAEIAEEFLHPGLQKTIAHLLLNCKDELDVIKLNTILQ